MAIKTLIACILGVTLFLSVFTQDLQVENTARKLNILAVLPCFGGHFTSMAGVINALSQQNHNVIAMVISNCSDYRLKVSNVTDAANKVIVRDLFIGADLEPSLLKTIKKVFEVLEPLNQKLKDHMKVYLENEGKEEKFDVAIVDYLSIGAQMETELHGIPTVVNFAGDAGPVEYVMDRFQRNIPSTTWYSAVIVQQILGRSFHSWIQKMMKEENLMGAEYLTGIFWCEYGYRFPVLIHGSRFFYPAAGSDVRHVYIGARRDLKDYAPLDQELKDWLDEDSKSVIYVSFGSHVIFSGDEIEYILRELEDSLKFRFIWSVNAALKKRLDKKMIDGHKIYYKSNIPQVAVLSNSKVIAFVTHGGMNSVFDAIMNEKIMICMPAFGDQINNCDIVNTLEMGKATYFPFKPREILSTVDQMVLDKNKYLNNIKQMKKTFKDTGEYDAMEKFIVTVATEQWMPQPILHPLQSLKFYLLYYLVVGLVCGILVLALVIIVGLVYYCCFQKKIKKD